MLTVTPQQQWSAVLTREGLVLPIAWRKPLKPMWKKLNKNAQHSLQTYWLPGTSARQLQLQSPQMPLSKLRCPWFNRVFNSPIRGSQEKICTPLSSHSNPYNRAGMKTAVPRLAAWIWELDCFPSFLRGEASWLPYKNPFLCCSLQIT